MDYADKVAKYMNGSYTVNLEVTGNISLSEKEYDDIVKQAEIAFDTASPELQLAYLHENDEDIEKAASSLIEKKIGWAYPTISFVVKYL